MGLLNKGSIFAHTKISGEASFAILNERIKICCASASSQGTRVFERFCQSHFIEAMQHGPCGSEARCLQFTLQRPGGLICIPHLLAHAVLNLDAGSPTFLSRLDTATATNQQRKIKITGEYTLSVRRG